MDAAAGQRVRAATRGRARLRAPDMAQLNDPSSFCFRFTLNTACLHNAARPSVPLRGLSVTSVSSTFQPLVSVEEMLDSMLAPFDAVDTLDCGGARRVSHGEAAQGRAAAAAAAHLDHLLHQ